MKLDQIKLVHVANHKETIFDFPDVPIIALVGDSGSGKTSLIEAIPLSIYGIGPSRNSGVYQAATRDWEGKCAIEIILSEDGRRLKIQRTWVQASGTIGSSHKVFIFEDLGTGWEKISSGKVTDAKKITDQLFPPYEIFLTTNFASQTGESLLSASQEDRREILGSLLSPILFSEFDALHETTATERRLEEKRNVKIKQRLEFVHERLQKLDGEDVKSISVLKKECEGVEAVIQQFSDQLSEIVHQGNELKARSKEIEYQLESLQRIEKDTKTEQARLEEVKKEIADYSEETFDEHQFELLAMEKAAKSKLQDQLEIVQNERTQVEKDLSKLEARRLITFTKIQTINRAVVNLEDLPCDDELQLSCPLVKDTAAEKARLPDLEHTLDQKEKEIAKATTKKEKKDKEATAILKKVNAFADLNAKEKELMGFKHAISIQKTNHDSLLREEKQIQDRIAKFQKESEEITIDPEAQKIPGKVGRLREQWTACDKKLDEQRKNLSTIRRFLTLAESREEEKEKSRAEIGEVTKSVKISDAEMEIWRILEEGFSRQGAQTLLLKMELDLFEQIIQEYLDIIFENTGNEVRLSFETERQLKSKDEIRESLGIKIELNGIELQANELSGGEIQGVSIALRAGLLSYHALKNPGHLAFLILDEPTSSTDNLISLNAVGVFEKLGEVFEQLIVATYDEDLMQSSKIYKVRKVDGVANITEF
jgi:DNA repair exonuclease SbcCD ATPase subunit